jgi:hypothetical protein
MKCPICDKAVNESINTDFVPIVDGCINEYYTHDTHREILYERINPLISEDRFLNR